MASDLEPRRETPSEVIAMIKGEIAARRLDGGAEIHIHYHAGAPAAPPPTCAHDHAPNPADRLVPYFVILLGGMIVVGGLGVITILLVPAIMALATTIAIVFGSFAAVMIAIAASTRSLRQTGTDRKIMDQRLRATGRRRR